MDKDKFPEQPELKIGNTPMCRVMKKAMEKLSNGKIRDFVKEGIGETKK